MFAVRAHTQNAATLSMYQYTAANHTAGPAYITRLLGNVLKIRGIYESRHAVPSSISAPIAAALDSAPAGFIRLGGINRAESPGQGRVR